MEKSSPIIEIGIVVINRTTRHWKIIRFIFANVDCFIYTRTAAPRTSRPSGGLSIGAWWRKGTIIDRHSGRFLSLSKDAPKSHLVISSGGGAVPLVISSGGGAGVEKSPSQFVRTSPVLSPLSSICSRDVLFLAEKAI